MPEKIQTIMFLHKAETFKVQKVLSVMRRNQIITNKCIAN